MDLNSTIVMDFSYFKWTRPWIGQFGYNTGFGKKYLVLYMVLMCLDCERDNEAQNRVRHKPQRHWKVRKRTTDIRDWKKLAKQLPFLRNNCPPCETTAILVKQPVLSQNLRNNYLSCKTTTLLAKQLPFLRKNLGNTTNGQTGFRTFQRLCRDRARYALQ